jgi:nucleoside-diphosphate-sugar epimerase
VLGPADSYVSSIQVADAAAAVAAALGAPAGTFNIVDDEPLTKRQYADALARAAGTTMWLRGPGRAALVFGDRLTSLTRSLRVSNARFRTATGWAPRYPSAREGWIATATAINHSRIAA